MTIYRLICIELYRWIDIEKERKIDGWMDR